MDRVEALTTVLVAEVGEILAREAHDERDALYVRRDLRRVRYSEIGRAWSSCGSRIKADALNAQLAIDDPRREILKHW